MIKNRTSKILPVLFLCAFLFSACGINKLSGTYSSESGIYSVEFESDGTCTWYQDGHFFNGTYERDGDLWQLEIVGDGLYSNTVFTATPDGQDIIINGGQVSEERFIKQ